MIVNELSFEYVNVKWKDSLINVYDNRIYVQLAGLFG